MSSTPGRPGPDRPRPHRFDEFPAGYSLAGCAPAGPQNVLTAQRILELANRAHSLYLTRNHTERGHLPKSVLLNCATDGVNLTPTYRKPFDLIFQRAKNEEWSGRGDLNSRPPAPKVNSKMLSSCLVYVFRASCVTV